MEYRGLIDALQDVNVNWTPYTPEVVQELPPSCMIHQDKWLRRGPLIDFAIVETHHPERVMRQFNLHQQIPPPLRSTSTFLHDLDRSKFPKADWLHNHREYLDEWDSQRVIEEQEPFDPDCLTDYFNWYNKVTIPTFQSVMNVGVVHAAEMLSQSQSQSQHHDSLIKKLVCTCKTFIFCSKFVLHISM